MTDFAKLAAELVRDIKEGYCVESDLEAELEEFFQQARDKAYAQGIADAVNALREPSEEMLAALAINMPYATRPRRYVLRAAADQLEREAKPASAGENG